MTTTLTIPDHLSSSADGRRALHLPDEAVTQGFFILARRRSGKSVLAGVMEEEFLRRGDPFVVLDPASAHWGIRYKAPKTSKEGKPAELEPSGFNVMVVGGEHGDIELNPAAGRELAEIIVETNVSVVIDLLMVGPTDRKRFVCDLVNRLFQINQTPRHVFIEEAHELVPQNPRFREQMDVLAAIERLIKGGGGRGIGYTLISQRPAAVNKDVLTQVDNGFIMRMSGPTDMDAVKKWFEHNVGDKAELQRVLSTLPHLKVGEAWVIGSEWVGHAERCQVRQRVTYHAGRTPKRGEQPVQVKQYEVTEVAERFKALVKEKKAEAEQKQQTEKELRARIRELEGQFSSVGDDDNKVDASGLLQARVDAQQAQERLEAERRRRHIVAGRLLRFADSVTAVVADMRRACDDLDRCTDFERQIEKEEPLDESLRAILPLKVNWPTPDEVRGETPYPQFSAPAKDKAATNGKLRDGAKRMLAAVCQWHPEAMSVTQMRSHAGLKKSGTFDAYMRDLRNGNYIEQNGDMVRATREGLAYFGGSIPKAPRSTSEVLAVWEPKLRDGARRILRALVQHRGREVSYSTLYDEAQLTKSGTFDAYMRDLRSARLIVTRKGHAAANKETLFL